MNDLPDEERIILSLYSRLVSVAISIQRLAKSLPAQEPLEEFQNRLGYLLLNNGNPPPPQSQEYDPDLAKIFSYYEKQLKSRPARKPKVK